MFNVLTLTRAIQKIGEAIPNLNTTIVGDVFELNSRPDIDYSVFAIVQEEHSIDEDFLHLRYVLYYIDRLLNDGSNRLEIQSHGLEILSLIINKIEELGLVINKDFNTTTFQPFHQRFSDECAGVYSRLEIQVPIDCTTPYDVLVNPLLADLSTWQAGVYNPEDFGVDAFRTVTVSGQSFHYFTENEGDKTATIDNGHHNIEVTKSGATYDGYPIVNTQTLSAYTYSKNDVLNLTQYEIGQALSPVKAQVSANTEDIAELSGSTVALSASTQGSINATNNNLQTLSAGTQDAISAITGNISAITDEIETVSANTIANANGIETLSAATQNEISAITENLQTLSASTVELSGRTVTNTNDIAAISAITSSNTVDIIILSGNTSANTQNINILSGVSSSHTTQITELSGLTSANTENITTLSGLTSANTADIAALSAQTSGITGALLEQVEELSGATSGLSSNLQELSSVTISQGNDIETLSGLTSSHTENITTLSSITSSNTVDINTLSGVSSAHTTQITELSGLTSANTQNIETLSGITSGLSADIAALSAQTSGLTSALTIQVAELSGLTSANTENITTLSSITSANTTDIQALSAITSGLSDVFVKKDPINVEGTQENPIDFNDLTAETGYYYVRTNNSYAINHPSGGGWMPDGMLEVVRDPNSIRMTQVFTANFGSIQAGDWPKRWYRVYCYLAEGYFGWSAWQEIANNGDIKTLSGLTSANTQAIATLSAMTSGVSSAITAQIEELSGLTSANTQNINVLSGATSGLSSDLQALSAQTTANTYTINSYWSNITQHTWQINALSGATSANTTDIATLSGLTSANTQDIATLSSITSGLTNGVYVEKAAIPLSGTSANTVNYNNLSGSGYYYVDGEYTSNSPFEPDEHPDTYVHVLGNGGEQVLTTKEENPRQYYRVYVGGNSGYTDWVQVITSDNAIMKTPEILTNGTIDFDDITTTGYYYIMDLSATILNAPENITLQAAKCILSVVAAPAILSQSISMQVTQECTIFDLNNPIPRRYMRVYQGSWSGWYEYTLTPVNQQ